MDVVMALSTAARGLLEWRFAGERVEVTEATRPLYRELVAAGLMMPLHTFALGRDSAYRLTDAGAELRAAFNVRSTPVPFGGGGLAPSA